MSRHTNSTSAVQPIRYRYVLPGHSCAQSLSKNAKAGLLFRVRLPVRQRQNVVFRATAKTAGAPSPSLLTRISQLWPWSDKSSVATNDLLTYGDFAQITYDNFNGEGTRWSTAEDIVENCLKGSSSATLQKLQRADIIPIFALAGRNSGEDGLEKTSAFQGYIIVTKSDARGLHEVICAWRGSIRTGDWVSNSLVRFTDYDKDRAELGRVHRGFKGIYFDGVPAKGNVSPRQLVEDVLRQYKGKVSRVSTCGHSLGGALSTLSAFHIADFLKTELKEGDVPVTAYTFASPRVGNSVFKAAVQRMGLKVWRVVNEFDVVPMVPPRAVFVGHVDDEVIPGRWLGAFNDDVADFIGDKVADFMEGRASRSSTESAVSTNDPASRSQALEKRLAGTGVDVDTRKKMVDTFQHTLEDAVHGLKASLQQQDEEDKEPYYYFDIQDRYVHVGTEIEINFFDEKDDWAPSKANAVEEGAENGARLQLSDLTGLAGDLHNLEAYLHVLADERDGQKRDPALLNKSTGCLAKKIPDASGVPRDVPVAWWKPEEGYKGMQFFAGKGWLPPSRPVATDKQ